MSKEEKYGVLLNSIGYYEVAPRPSVEDLERHYKDKYYQSQMGSYSSVYSEAELRFFRNAARVAFHTSDKLGLENSLLDLGCGEGFFAKSFHDFGWSVACCDYSEFGISRHNPEMLDFFRAGDISGALKTYSELGLKYGLINLQNVLEHVLDPVELLHSIKCLLGRSSAVRIKVPNDYSDYQLALVSQGFSSNSWFSPPEHLSYFNEKSLRAIVDHCGYRLLSLQANFPIEVFLANSHSNYWRDRALGKEAHFARVFCENHLIEKDVDAYIDYSESAAKLGFGRELIAYISL